MEQHPTDQQPTDPPADRARDRELRNLLAENQRLGSLLSLLSDLSLRITSSLDLASVLQEVVDAACDLTGARYGALGVFDPSGRIQQFITHGITRQERERIGDLPRGLGLLGWLHQSQCPLRLDDLSGHPRSVGFPAHHPPMKSFLGAPLRLGSDSLGNLYLTEKAGGGEFTPEDESLLALFAAQAALAIHNATLHQQVELERQRLDTILTNSPNGIIYIDAATGRVQANPRAQQVLGASFDTSGDGLSALVEKFTTPRGSPLPLEDFSGIRALRGEFVAGDEHLILQQDGALLPVLCGAAPVRNGQGTVYGAIVQFQDLSSVKEAQGRIEGLAAERGRLLELAELEQKRLQALVDTSPVGVLVLDAVTEEITLGNREVQRMLGPSWSAGRRFDTHEIIRLRPDGREYPLEELPVLRALRRGENVRAEEVTFQFPDGHSIPTLVNATPVYSVDGQIMAAIAVIQDITPLEEVERLRSEFLGIVSHELRTPLTAIKGSAATVLGSRRPLDVEEMRELFQIIDEQADRLRDLVDNLLDLTRIEAGSLSVNTEPAELVELLEDARRTFIRGGGSQEVVVQVPQDLPPVQADRRRVVQVVGNLLSNAAKFSPTNAAIDIDVEQDQVYVTVRVRDLGRGIPPDRLPQLFRKFSQVHEDSRSRLAGSGLGLAICKGIVEAHGGRIWAESPGEGQGATFSFTLPVAQMAPVTSQPDPARRDQHLGRVSRSGERTRVLAVDDEPQILRYLERTLDEAGYHPVVTGQPAEVIRLLEVEEPDLVLLDLMLPGISGLELLQHIRELSGVPVIFLSARDQGEDMVQALKTGADDYITKPFSPSELLARIEVALRRRVLPDQTEVRPPFVLGDLTINFAQRQVTLGARAVALSATEYKLLYELATHAGLVLTHGQILQRVWGPEYSGETELVRSFIRNLRRKLGDDARHPRYIFTEPQVGYRMPRP